MAQDIGGLAKAMDISNTNLYGVDEERLQELRDAQSKAIEALQHRYDNPNWFKVAAGFAKPQLGGFVASLGSASDALGDWLEEKRQNQVPVSQLELTKAQSNMLLGNKAKAADIMAKIKSENRQPTPAEIQDVTNLDPVRGKMLLEAQAGRAATVNNNIAITRQNYEARGLPVPPLNEMGLPETGNYPTGANKGGGGTNGIPDNVTGTDKGPTQNVPESTFPKGGIENNIGGENTGRTLPSVVQPPAVQEKPKTEVTGFSNHNPGNIMFGDFAKAHGATGAASNGTAIFPDDSSGTDAQHALLGTDRYKSLPLNQIPSVWAPKEQAGNNPDAYTSAIQKITGFDDKKMGSTYGDLSLSDQKKFRDAQAQFEHGTRAESTGTKHVQANQENPPHQREVVISNWRDSSPINPYTNQAKGVSQTQEWLNGQGKAYGDNLFSLGNDQVHTNVMRPISNLESEAQDPRFNQVMGILGGKGYLSGLAQLIQSGVNMNVDTFNANLGVNLQKIAQASLPSDLVPFAQDVYRNLAQMGLNNQKSAGINPNQARNAELSVLSDASAHPETSPAAAKLYIRQSNLIQRMNRDMFLDHRKLMEGSHPDYVLDSKSPVQLYDASRSKSQQSIIDDYNKALDNEMKQFREQTAAKKDKKNG